MITKADILKSYSCFDEYANVKHDQLDKNLIKEIRENAIKIFEDPLTEDNLDGIILSSMEDSKLKEYAILKAIVDSSIDDPFLVDEIEHRIDDIKDSYYVPKDLFVEDCDYPTNYEYEIEEEYDSDCQFD